MQNFNNYNNPYGYNNFYQQPKTNQYAFVNGIEGAKAYQVPPSQMMMLLDNDNPIIYKKITDSYGKAYIEYYKMVPTSEDELRGINKQCQPEYVLKADFDALVERINEFTKKESV